MKRVFYSCIAICAATALSGCHTPAGKRLSAMAEQMQRHSKPEGALSMSASKKSPEKKTTSQNTMSTAEQIGAIITPGESVAMSDGRYAVAERRYVSLTGQPCVIATIGSYNGIDASASEEEDMLSSSFFASEERNLSCKRNGEWALYPYHGRAE